MHRIIPHRALTVLFAGVFALGLTACDAASSADDAFGTLETRNFYNALSSELDLTSGQQDRLSDTFSRHHEARTPGSLWIVADSLSETLTDEQIAGLVSRTGSIEGDHPFRGLHGFPGGGGIYGLGGFKGGSHHHGLSPLDSVLGLTETQQAQIQAIHESSRGQIRTLREALGGGTITEEEFLRQTLALHEAKDAELQAVLTAEQQAALVAYRAEREAAFEAFRDAVNAVRNQVLGLTAAQSAAFDAVIAGHLDDREVLLEQFQAGSLSLAELETEIEALRAAQAAALEALLTDEQYEVVQIHDALAVRAGRHGHKGHHSGPHGGPHGGPRGDGPHAGSHGPGGFGG